MQEQVLNDQPFQARVGDFHQIVVGMQETYNDGQVFSSTKSVFRAGKIDLWDTYLNSFPPEQRQEFDCACCRGFLRRYGSLVQVTDNGSIKSIMWNEDNQKDDFWKPIVKALREKVESAKRVTSFTILTDSVIGHAQKGGFDHFALNTKYLASNRFFDKGKFLGEKQQAFQNTIRELSVISPVNLERTKVYLENGKFNQAEKFLAPVQWWIDLKAMYDAASNQDARVNLVWRAVAEAPLGWPNLGTAHGKLIFDVASGDSIETAARKHNAVTAPTVYQQASTPASDGNIKRAEQIIGEMGLASALKRRHATAEELVKIWTPRPTQVTAENVGSLFGHMLSKPEVAPIRELVTVNDVGSADRITWDQFQKTVLDSAVKMEVLAHGQRQGFIGFTTAVDPEAKPLMRWDTEEKRNPVGWFLYADGSYPHDWNLDRGYHEVVGIAPLPFMNDAEPMENGLYHGFEPGYCLLMKGAQPVQLTSSALFPQIVRSDLHEIRDTLWNFSKNEKMAKPAEGATTGGQFVSKAGSNDFIVRVTTDQVVRYYRVDRWI